MYWLRQSYLTTVADALMPTKASKHMSFSNLSYYLEQLIASELCIDCILAFLWLEAQAKNEWSGI